MNSTETIAGKEVYSLNKSNVYRFDKRNLLEYMDSIKDEFILNLFYDYKNSLEIPTNGK